MRLATDIFAITHGNLAVRLRPSLRAALHLHRAYDFRTIFANVIDGHFGTIRDVLETTADDPRLARRIFDLKIQQHTRNAILEFQATLLPLLATAFGIDDSAAPDAKPSRTVTLEQSLQNLFEIGTGWLGWTPADTWASTPGEIIAAHRGLIAKLKAIHGSADDKPDDHDPNEEISEAQMRKGIDRLKANARRGRK